MHLGWTFDLILNQLPSLLGWLPLDSLLVETNAFRVPNRRVWERDGTLLSFTILFHLDAHESLMICHACRHEGVAGLPKDSVGSELIMH